MRYLLASVLFIAIMPSSKADPPVRAKYDPELEAWGAKAPQGDPVKDPELWTFSNREGSGYVASVNNESITLYRPAWKLMQYRHDPNTGVQLGVSEEEFPAVPAKRFFLCEDLARGGYLKTATYGNTYRVADVQPGDRVSITYLRKNGVDICQMIRIDRRPGGQIPPAPGEKPNEFRKWHERMQADQDWEEKRTPYPRKYWPGYCDANGLHFAAPYPQESRQFVPIVPRIPPAKD